ncbi:hypothetical protein Tco_1497718 [Tanacetum coccineum]
MHIEKNALEALLNTLLQNDKSKDTLKARQDLQTLGVRKELWLVKKPNGKFEKPHPKYSFTAENRKLFCKFIKGVRLPDGFGSNFKQKVTADDNNITGLKSFKTDQEILDEIVPSDNRQNMSGMGRKLPGGGSTSRRRANRAFGDIMTRDQITQMFRQQE